MDVAIGTVISFLLVFLICGGLYGCPQYNVYSQRMEGEAELAKAEYSKQVAVQTSQAKLDAAKLEAQTDVTRADGVAKANKILADGLGGPDGYLRWKYIQMLEDTASSSSKTVIYVPTDGMVPLFEAGRGVKQTDTKQ